MDPEIVIVPRSEIAGHDLFPLDLARMERFMLLDDTPKHPKRFRVSMQFEGPIDPDLMKHALDLSIRRHPMLLATPDRKRFPRRWLLEEKPSWRFCFGPYDFATPPEVYRQSVADPDHFCGTWVWGGNQGKHSAIVFDFHHANCDGLGARIFTRDMLVAYNFLTAQKLNPTEPKPIEERASQVTQDKVTQDVEQLNQLWSSLEVKDLIKRDEFYRPEPDAESRPTTFWEKVVHAFHFHCLGPVSLVRSKSPRAKNITTSSVIVHRSLVLDKALTERIVAKCDAMGVRLNDIAIALLMQTASQWNSDAGKIAQGHRIRIMIPTDLRSMRDRTMPACNRFSFAFVIATNRVIRNRLELEAQVRDQMDLVRKLRLGFDFVDILGIVQNTPGLDRFVHFVLRWPRSLSTAVLTNLGDVTRRHRRRYKEDDGRPVLGNLVLESVLGAPPIRSGTALGVGLCVASGRLALAFTLDQACFGQQVDAIPERYREAWIHWLEQTE